MAVIFARLRVSNLAHWRVAFKETEPLRAQNGIKVRAIYQDSTYHNGIIVVLDAEDLDRAMDYYNSDEQRQRMTRSGMERPAEMWMGTDLPID